MTLVALSFGVYVAIWKLVNDQQWRMSETYLEESKELFQRSFDSLKNDLKTKYPKNDRLNWLTSARLLLAAEEIGTRITNSAHKATFQEYRDFWQAQFSSKLSFFDDNPESVHYFYEDGHIFSQPRGVRAPINEESIAVIYRFITSSSTVDRIHSVKKFTIDEIETMHRLGANALSGYLKDRRRARES